MFVRDFESYTGIGFFRLVAGFEITHQMQYFKVRRQTQYFKSMHQMLFPDTNASDRLYNSGCTISPSQIASPSKSCMGHGGSMGFAWVLVSPFKSHPDPTQASPLSAHVRSNRPCPLWPWKWPMEIPWWPTQKPIWARTGCHGLVRSDPEWVFGAKPMWIQWKTHNGLCVGIMPIMGQPI